MRVVGRDHKGPDENLEKVMRKSEQDGLTPNYEKFRWSQKHGVHGRSAKRGGAAGLQEESGSDC